MITAIDNAQQPSFQAKLKINGVKLPESDKISKKFESITQHYKNDVFEVVDDIVECENGSSFKNTTFISNGNEIGYISTLKEFKDFCKAHTPEQIAKSLAIIFKAGKLTEKTNAKTNTISKNIRSATETLYRAKNGQPNKVNNALIENTQKRIKFLIKAFEKSKAEKAETNVKIFGNDPIKAHFESLDN